jgi:hypothetical protein
MAFLWKYHILDKVRLQYQNRQLCFLLRLDTTYWTKYAYIKTDSCVFYRGRIPHIGQKIRTIQYHIFRLQYLQCKNTTYWTKYAYITKYHKMDTKHLQCKNTTYWTKYAYITKPTAVYVIEVRYHTFGEKTYNVRSPLPAAEGSIIEVSG